MAARSESSESPERSPAPRGGELRLQAYLARAGVASRRASEELIAAGRVKVNGAVVSAPGSKVRPGHDKVLVDGSAVEQVGITWLALHKPRGFVTTRIDPYNRRTVYELIPEKYHSLFHVGRLDRDSEGILLLTNDGETANRMLHPSFGTTKEYLVDVYGQPPSEVIAQLLKGVDIGDGVATAEEVQRLHQTGEDTYRLRIVLREGKKREIRRMMEAVGHPVHRLMRQRFGPVELGELPSGKWRVVSATEIRSLTAGDGDAPKRRRSATTMAGDAKPETAARPRKTAAGPRAGADERPARPARPTRPAARPTRDRDGDADAKPRSFAAKGPRSTGRPVRPGDGDATSKPRSYAAKDARPAGRPERTGDEERTARPRTFAPKGGRPTGQGSRGPAKGSYARPERSSRPERGDSDERRPSRSVRSDGEERRPTARPARGASDERRPTSRPPQGDSAERPRSHASDERTPRRGSFSSDRPARHDASEERPRKSAGSRPTGRDAERPSRPLRSGGDDRAARPPRGGDEERPRRSGGDERPARGGFKPSRPSSDRPARGGAKPAGRGAPVRPRRDAEEGGAEDRPGASRPDRGDERPARTSRPAGASTGPRKGPSSGPRTGGSAGPRKSSGGSSAGPRAGGSSGAPRKSGGPSSGPRKGPGGAGGPRKGPGGPRKGPGGPSRGGPSKGRRG